MTRQEFATFAMALRTYYPKENILPNQQAMELWYQEIQDIPAEIANMALRKWVVTNKWSPSIAEIREMTANVVNGEQMSWAESWEKVKYAIRKYGSYGKVEALESLDPLTRKCVESIGFTELCLSENEMADRAHYQRIFDIFANREKTQQKIPAQLMDAIKMVQIKGVDGERLKLGDKHE